MIFQPSGGAGSGGLEVIENQPADLSHRTGGSIVGGAYVIQLEKPALFVIVTSAGANVFGPISGDKYGKSICVSRGGSIKWNWGGTANGIGISLSADGMTLELPPAWSCGFVAIG